MAKTQVKTDAPTTEQGTVHALPFSNLMGWGGFAALSGSATENVPELTFPMSAIAYSRMRNDAQVNGLLQGTMLPITRYEWYIDPNGAEDSVVERLADDLGLPIDGDDPDRPKRRIKRRFNFNEHIRLALRALAYGFYFFEQLMEYGEADQLLHLRKLAERPPWSITEIRVAKDGGMTEIRQPSQEVGAAQEQVISIDRLLAYVWDKEGANWTGRSLLRSCYGPWLIKDRIMRVGAINIERNGAGTPIIEAPPGADRGEIEWLNKMAQQFKAGSSAGGAIPAGTKLTLKGVEGTQPDAVGFMKFLNEEMSRSFLMMFMQLGQSESGSRSLGSTMIDWFGLSQGAIADWFMNTFNEHQIEDDIDWNHGEDAPAPKLAYNKNEEEEPTADLKQRVEDEEVEVDEETQEQLEATPASRRTSRRRLAGSGRASAKRRGRAVSGAGESSPVPLPTRTLRRQPYSHEIAAATDFAALDSAWESALDLMDQESRMLIASQIDELHDYIVMADGDLDDLMEMSATPMHAASIESKLIQVADIAAQQAIQEAQSQGVSIDRPSVDDLHATLRERAAIVDSMIARDVTLSATRRAIRLTGGSLSPTEVADQVRDDMKAMAWAGVKDQLGGSLTTAQNAGRGLVFRRDDHPGRIYSSELLDVNTCGPCASRDGAEYPSMAEAERDYPTGGYKACEGRERCRGTLVKVYDTEDEPTFDRPFGV